MTKRSGRDSTFPEESLSTRGHRSTAAESTDCNARRADFTGTDRFSVLRPLGSGGMGAVYEVYDHHRCERVALKTLSRIDPASLYRFKQEFRSLADTVHPNLVRLYELLSDDRDWYFTMELIQGTDLLSYVRGEEPAGPCTAAPGRLLSCLTQLAEGLLALHQRAKLHCDIKPSNILVTPGGRVVLLDFGLVAELGPGGVHQSSQQNVLGTVGYMAPEQAAGQTLSPASDWYAFGVILHLALTGELPMAGHPGSFSLAEQGREVPEPRPKTPGVPEALYSLCVDLLRHECTARPSGSEVLRRLKTGDGGAGREAVESRCWSPPFVGRQRQLEELRDAFAELQQGQTTLLLIRGQSGIGKTTLVQRFLEELERRLQAVVLAGRCYQQETVPYKAFDGLIDSLSHHLCLLPTREVQRLLPHDVSALIQVFPVLRRVAAVQQAPRLAVQAPDQQQLRRRAFSELRDLLGRLGERQPLVLSIDDLQWADRDSMALLAELIRSPEPPRFLLLGCLRIQQPTDALLPPAFPHGHPGVAHRELVVAELDEREAEQLALSLLGLQAAASGLAAATIARESGGNPLFVLELVDYVRARAGVGADLCGADVTLDQVLRSRIARLNEGQRRLLEVAAVASRPLPLGEACQAAGLQEGVSETLTFLRNSRFLRSASAAGQEEQLEPYHDRIRESVVADLSPMTRRAHHRQIALTAEGGGGADAEFLAVHFHEADEPAKAAEYFAAAAAQAARQLAFDRAAELYRQALADCAGDAERKRQLNLALADTLAHAGRGGEAARYYLLAAGGAGPHENLELQRRAAYQNLISGHVDPGLQTMRRLLAVMGLKFPQTRRKTLLGLLLRRLLVGLRGLGFRERAAEQISPDTLLRIDVCWSAGAGLTMIDTVLAAYFHTRGLLFALRAGEPSRIVRALAIEVMHAASAGGPLPSRVADALQIAETLGGKIGHPHARGWCRLAAGSAAYLQGRWKTALQCCDQADALFRDRCVDVAWELDSARLFSLWSLWWTGDIAELGSRLPAVWMDAVNRGDVYASTMVGTSTLALVQLTRDDPLQALQTVNDPLHCWSEESFRLPHYNRLMTLSSVDLYRGDGSAAWQRMSETWPALEGSLLLRIQMLRIFARYTRCLCALAVASETANPRPLLRTARRDARALERERMAWAGPLAQAVRAKLAAVAGDRSGAVALLQAAAAGFDAADMLLHATAMRRRRGELLGEAEGQRQIEAADACMRAHQIQNPQRMADVYAPRISEDT